MSGVKGGHYGANEQPHKNPQRRIDALRVAQLRVERRTRLLLRAYKELKERNLMQDIEAELLGELK